MAGVHNTESMKPQKKLSSIDTQPELSFQDLKFYEEKLTEGSIRFRVLKTSDFSLKTTVLVVFGTFWAILFYRNNWIHFSAFWIFSLIISWLVYQNEIIEEQLLSVEGLGIQLSSIRRNGHQARSTFIPAYRIASVYIFEGFHRYRTRPFLNILTNTDSCHIAFQNLIPPVLFLKEIYLKLNQK